MSAENPVNLSKNIPEPDKRPAPAQSRVPKVPPNVLPPIPDDVIPTSKSMPRRAVRPESKNTDEEDPKSWLCEKWENRPSVFELIIFGVSSTSISGAIYIGLADEVFDQHIAQDMAHVRVIQHPHGFEEMIKQAVQQAVHDTGKLAVELEK